MEFLNLLRRLLFKGSSKLCWEQDLDFWRNWLYNLRWNYSMFHLWYKRLFIN